MDEIIAVNYKIQRSSFCSSAGEHRLFGQVLRVEIGQPVNLALVPLKPNQQLGYVGLLVALHDCRIDSSP
jgi:hypothetical protein